MDRIARSGVLRSLQKIAIYPDLGLSDFGIMEHVGANQRQNACMVRSVFSKDYKRFLALLIAERKSAGLTQQDLADRLGKPQSFVSKYERGERRLDVVEFISVVRIMGADPGNIVTKLTARTAGSR